MHMEQLYKVPGCAKDVQPPKPLFQVTASLDHSSVDASRSVGFKVASSSCEARGLVCRFVSAGDEPVLRGARAEPLDICFDLV